jgi:hypothetical protein
MTFVAPEPSGLTVQIVRLPVLSLEKAIFPFSPGNAACAVLGRIDSASTAIDAILLEDTIPLGPRDDPNRAGVRMQEVDVRYSDLRVERVVGGERQGAA